MKKIIKKRENKKSIIMGDILRLLGSGIAIPTIFLFPGSAIIIREFLKEKDINKQYVCFQKNLNRALKKRLIRIIQKDDNDFLEITKLGKKELLRYDIDELEIEKSKAWDGKWRMVIFDIPEKFKNARVALSRKLKSMGFYGLQKSVFIYPYECENEIDFIREFFDVKKFVILLCVPTMGDYYDLILKKHFDLF